MANSLKGKRFSHNRGGILCLLSFLLLLSSASAQKLTCEVNRNVAEEKYGQVAITGFGGQIEQFRTSVFSDQEWAQFYSMRVKGATRPMLGSYEVSGDMLVFIPRFLPDPNVTYEVSFSPKEARKFLTQLPGDAESRWVIKFHGELENTAQVIGFSPESDVLPANILRFYLVFSEPMSFENPHDFIQIEDEDGRVLAEPFVEIEEGLWNANRTRLTLLLHPGRIKRGVGPNMTMGEIFEQNHKYSLKVSNSWKASSGRSLKESFEKTFSVSEPIRKIVDVENWKIELPSAKTNQQLVIRTNSLLDKALAERMVLVANEEGKLVKGSFEFDAEKETLFFDLSAKWSKGKYELRVNPKLEDVCGNTPINVFDLEGSSQKEVKEAVTLEFTLK